MAKQLAIEWDDKELRVIAARPHGNRFAVTDAFTIETSEGDTSDIGSQLESALSKRGLTRLPTLVAIGRARAELRQLNLPSIPDEELPEVVRFQAIRQFAAAGERAAIDYLPIERSEDGVEVAAAAVAPEHVQSIHKICAASELQLERIVLRPTAAAALFKLTDIEDTDETILIDTLVEEVDIIVIRNGNPAFLRSVRVPADEGDRIRSIVGEVRRSLMAARRDDDDSKSRRIIVWGKDSVQGGLLAALSESLKIPVQAIDPFELVEASKEIAGAHQNTGRFAPLLGLLEGHAHDEAAFIDFLNPRKRPEPKSNRDRYVVYGALATAVVLLGLWLGWSRLATEDRKYQALLSQSNELQPLVEASQARKADLDRIDQFLNGDVFVLGELANLSDKLAPSGEMQIDQLTITSSTRGGGMIDFGGVAKQPAAVSKMERDLRDADHEVTGDGAKSVPRREPYDYQFNVKIKIPQESIRKQRETPAPESTDQVQPSAEETQAGDST